MGRNGAGKSTTLKAIMGLLRRGSGAVRFHGTTSRRREPFDIARLGLGFVPEDRRIFTDLTVMENLEVGHASRRWRDGALRRVDAGAAVRAVSPISARCRTGRGGRMSGGEQQMLTVARTLMGNPYLVLLDEPSEGVAPMIVEQMAAHHPANSRRRA